MKDEVNPAHQTRAVFISSFIILTS
jgi:hypothetical protein